MDCIIFIIKLIGMYVYLGIFICSMRKVCNLKDFMKLDLKCSFIKIGKFIKLI